MPSLYNHSPKKNIEVSAHKFAPEILRKYDIRGTVDVTLAATDAYYIGLSYSNLLTRRNIVGRVVIAYDGRVSSVPFSKALVKGLNDGGIEVVNIGLAATPLLYFATASLKNIAGGIMITGSHNPSNQNGFKMIMDGKPLFDQDIILLGEMAAAGCVSKADAVIVNESADVTESYIETLLRLHPGLKSMKVVWDPGNGVVGAHMKALISKIPGQHHVINAEVDGTFPSHHPNPSVIANLQQLIRKVSETNSDIGFAFDGDGDRLGVVDKKGRIVWGDSLLLIMAEDLLSRHPKASIIADVKTGDWVFDKIKALGGTPILWRTGHSFIKTKMRETGALLAGEMSGHLFFAENYYGFDDAIMAAIKLLSILSASSKTLEEIVDSIPKMIGTPEISIPSTEIRKFAVIEELKDILKEKKVSFIDIDGIRVPSECGWWLVRASNTEANLILRAEANTHEELAGLISFIQEVLAMVGVDFAITY